ncbi:PREDICTED: uncharacterized protein K02A2.6-like [Cyphomyrmex costatus]|uniref:uncharacterized protein K02A2.6-like n=1 Tax=Cyphomyrmex costatus TaxID=456900 RepID=UPI0008522239|nr:PREDICTED: uncharacterized protein K02A2.6-like [Cyphomyrmex costatus]
MQTYRNDPPKVEVHDWEPAKVSFERVHVDYAGPFMGSYFFLMVDAFTKWPFVFVMKDITARSTIQKCEEIFMNFSCPETMVMDNGRSFRSTEFLQFLAYNKITPKFTAAYHPATNGQVERFVQTMKSSLQKMCAEAKNQNFTLKEALRVFLIQYRVTPHCATGVAPAERMFKRQLRTHLTFKLPNRQDFTNCNTNKIVREFSVGESVRCRNYNSKEKWKFGKIIQRIGKLHYSIRLEDGRVWERHVDQILRSKESGIHSENWYNQLDSGDPETPVTPDQVTVSLEENNPNETSSEAGENQSSPIAETSTPEPVVIRQKELPQRRRVPPAWVADFWMGQPRK